MIPRHHRVARRVLLALALGVAARAAPEATEPKTPAGPPAPPAPAPPAAEKTTAQAAGQPAPKPRLKLSERVTGQIADSFPAWRPPPPEPAEQAPPPPPDPGVVRMAPMVVKNYRLPRTEEDEWLTRKARDSELVKQYITPFDRYFLNRFTLPLFGVSPEARARMMYEQDRRLRDLQWMNDEIDQMKRLDPEGAKELKNIRDSSFIRPGE